MHVSAEKNTRSKLEEEASAPDSAVAFCADNLLPRMSALSFCENVSLLWAPMFRKPLSPCRL